MPFNQKLTDIPKEKNYITGIHGGGGNSRNRYTSDEDILHMDFKIGENKYDCGGFTIRILK